MRNTTVILILLLMLAQLSRAQNGDQEREELRMDFEAYDPPSTLVTPENPVKRAGFPFVDVHSHHWRMAEDNLDSLIMEMDALNMRVIVNLSGRSGDRLEAMMDNIKKYGYEDRIVLFANITLDGFTDEDWTERTVAQLEQDVESGARGLKIYKSQTMSEDEDGNRIPIDHAKLDPVWAKCGELDIPILIHAADPKPFWAPHDSTNERWLELKLRPRRKRGSDNPAPWDTIIAEQHNIFKKHPNTTFINAHFGWYANNLGKLGELLDEIPNMYVEFGAVIAELGRQPRFANQFFRKYQDRILFGKDSYHPEQYYTYFRVLETADEYFPYYKRYHAFWRMYGLDLPEEVLRKVYYENALKVIPGLDSDMFE